ncbi:MAG: 16S rRNA (cytosine(1402)-N(4))-methyltransferase RsmH [Clostridiales bacterium]|nr:16S rRNA (cytosine(1402)-N(4))-methyltransferase RsmH [Clostridia bacterium]MCR4563060.1 16S rRNA (cytosine(1402)-N(4))-methyltransferase RsmH [Clostridiales bacterium]
MEFSHFSVLKDESIDALSVKENGLYVDCTAGGGGHSAEILKRLKGGRLVAIDRDPDAIEVLKERFRDFDNVEIVNDTFDNISSVLNGRKADGILADLGVSSFQLDTAERGFSFHKDAPLDMRMSKSGTSAADLVNTLPENELARIIRDYGEEKYARSIASNIVKARAEKRIETTFELVDIIKKSMPMKAMRDSHPARRTFQALRIEVNGELEKLSVSLDEMFDALNEGGVLAVITFHSLEDRMVKQRFASYCQGCTCPRDFPVCVCGKTPSGELLFKNKKPSQEELDLNPRSRSATLRAVRKLKEREK